MGPMPPGALPFSGHNPAQLQPVLQKKPNGTPSGTGCSSYLVISADPSQGLSLEVCLGGIAPLSAE